MVLFLRPLTALLVLPAALGGSALVSGLSGALVTEAHALGRQAGRLLAASQAPRARGSAPIPVAPADAVLASNAARPEAGAARRPTGRSASRRAAARAVFIGHDTMLRLANVGVIPEGRPVPRSARRPPGIELRGVQALGVGMEEGDVLTEVEGRSVTAEPQVVTAVLVALARHQPTISAAFFRKGERWSLVVEIPYDARPPSDR